MADMINHPPHYTAGDVECIDAIKASMEPIEYAGFLKGQVMKYMWRFEKKHSPLEDLGKARFYLDKLEEFISSNPAIPFEGRQEFTISLADATMSEPEAAARVKKALDATTMINAGH